MQQNTINNWQKIVKFGSHSLYSHIVGLSLAALIIGTGISFGSASTPPDSSGAISRPTLKLGSKGTAVSELQAALKLLGYYDGEVDGIYGKTTAQSVSKFQQAAGLTPDGIAGESTWKRLFPATPTVSTPKPTPSSTPKPTPSPTPTPEPQVEATSAPTIDLPTLRLGMRGAAVSGLQQRLKALGFFSAKIDGVFGSKTEIAVKAVQKKFKIKPDGIVGKSTWEAILR
ncbi:peptidoglycan-binding domain-containing protein [Merismopedia glauca]|uniref:Peptidoglycan-binding protein n=1 Tax=Merismopedia glauca CCAP 1448/3 TaxID=1296344 RepID=A0A2T1C5Y3_9CYAN|nr:peptidoglycan-binding protein [Merismopedia glauca]PSB03671.1 peptidoglycan-binding protein [Merismopedia glauca CCAP 1448/3]